MLDNSEEVASGWSKILEIYENDELFKKCVDEDCNNSGHNLRERDKLFILEEILVFYLSAKGKLVFNNKFISGTEQWVLQCYPGKPLKSEVYLFQKNPFKLSNPKNKYENSYYDLSDKKLYDYLKLDINTFDFKD